jgi:hypothetical protein
VQVGEQRIRVWAGIGIHPPLEEQKAIAGKRFFF